MFCCGRFRKGRFCPECGNSMACGDATLSGLLNHCRGIVARFKAKVDAAKPGTTTHKKQSRNLERWSTWARLLEDLLHQVDETRS